MEASSSLELIEKSSTKIYEVIITASSSKIHALHEKSGGRDMDGDPE
jgi:hypothetical protein